MLFSCNCYPHALLGQNLSVGILNGCFLYSFSCHMPHAQTRQIESVRKYQFKELALYAFQNLF
ncbi:hypothetical protein BM51_1534 [Streptococcus pneumoniae]|nr:hypothetical protein BM51_1534 [Streptococcus pneumoniae]